MKHALKLLPGVIAALALPAAAKAATLTQAQITQIVRDVKAIDPAKGAHPAALKETLQGQQSVRTGIESRTELLFNDNTITRLGANTHFSFAEGTRNMSLDRGVMLLQVPKGIGGAKIETAAVTAAVTGTTIMLEAGKDYTKLIVLEGECCLWPREEKKRSKLFKFRHKVCASAGQEIILRNGSDIPDPVWVNLRVLENTSLLINGKWGVDLNQGPIDVARDGQNPKDFIPTNLAIIGAGTDVVVIQGERPPGEPDGGSTNPPVGGPNPTTGPIPGKYGPLTTISSPNPYVIGGGSTINTDPVITTNGSPGYGKIYRGTTLDGHAAPYFFGPGSGVGDTVFDSIFADGGSLFPHYGVAVFRFSNLQIQGTPVFQISSNGADDLALISEGAITLSAATPVTLDFSPIHDLLLATANGGIDIGPNITLQGLGGSLHLFNNGAANNITIDGFVNLPNAGFFATTQGTFGGSGSISSPNINVQAGGLITLNGPGAVTVNNVGIDTGVLQSLTLSGNGIDVLNGFSGPNVFLNLTATAGNALPGDISLGGAINAGFIFANASRNVNTLSGASINTNDFNVSAGNNANLDGTILASSLFVFASNAATIASTATISSDNIQFTAGQLQLDGVIQGTDGTSTSFQSSTFAGNSDVQDFFGSGTIDARTVSISSSGALVLDQASPSGPSTVNGVGVDPFGNLQELDLTGLTVAITNGFAPTGTVTFKVNASGDITIGGSINVNKFDASTNTQILVNNGATVTAQTVSLNVPNVNGTLSQSDVSTFAFDETTNDGNNTFISSVPIILNGGSPTLSLKASALDLSSDITAPNSNFTLNLTSVNDITGGATINGALSVSLQVGVSATLSGDSGSFIYYNNSAVVSDVPQLAIDTSNLSTFSFTATAGQSIAVESGFPSLNGSLSLTADGITVDTDLSTVGFVNFSANNGDLTVIGNLDIGGSATFSASGSILLGGNTVQSIGSSLSLSAGGSITLNNELDINGSLNLSAGTFLHTPGAAPTRIFGATDVTLNLGAAAMISQSVDTTALFFGALAEQPGFAPVQIDLESVTSISATGASLTLASDFNDAVGLSLSASNGNLVIDHTVTSSSFNGFASGLITGNGVITAANVSLHQGGGATLSQSGNLLSYGTLGVELSPVSGGATALSLSAGPLTLASDLSFNGVDLTLSGLVNTQGHNITAQNVTINNLQTVADGSGNATNLSILNSSSITFGNVSFFSTLNSDSLAFYSAKLDGADAPLAGSGVGGNGGTLTATTTTGDINVNSPIYATTGANGVGALSGGAGGTVNLTAQQGAVNVNSTIEVSSSDLLANRVSARGGNVNITSHKISGVAINIGNSGQINALLNQAAPGPGGTITFVADSGGSIAVNGKVRADHGTVNIQNTAGTGQVSLNGAQLAGDVVKVGALGNNGTLIVGNSVINADSVIKLYAGGSNGTVNFIANTTLSGASAKTIAANTVTINNSVLVNVLGPAATVFTNNANYTGSGGNGSTTGQFTGSGASTQPFANRPAF